MKFRLRQKIYWWHDWKFQLFWIKLEHVFLRDYNKKKNQ